MVTVGEYEEASDRWDAEGILEDIDTGFGLVPEGGLLEVSGFGSD